MSSAINKHIDLQITDENVASYLRTHPQFFYDHQALLTILRLPHPTGSAVSLIERQVSVLRDQNRALEHKLMELVQVARDNEQLNQHIHRFTLNLMQADSVDDIIATVSDHIHEHFASDRLAIRLIGEHSDLHYRGADDAGWMSFDSLMERGEPRCGRPNAEQMQFLFGDCEDIASTVLIPLIDQNHLGVMALASNDAQRFHPGMGTMFLTSMGELLARAIQVRQQS